MTDMTYVFAHLPNHGPSVNRATVAKSLQRIFTSAGITEGYKAVPLYAAHRDKVRIFAKKTRQDRRRRRGGWDNPILVSRGFRILDWGTKLASAAYLPNLKWNPERWITWVVYRTPDGPICHITVHPDPNIHTRRYAKALRMLDRRITWAEKKGYMVVVTGDLQTKDQHLTSIKRSARPADIFHRHKMSVVVEHIDWIAVDRRLRITGHSMTPVSELPKGQDHPLIYVTAVAR